MDLREFLVSAELDSYYNQLHDSLKVVSVGHLKFVDDQDLAGIGMTKPEIRRLRQFHKKACPQGAFSKLKKVHTSITPTDIVTALFWEIDGEGVEKWPVNILS